MIWSNRIEHDSGNQQTHCYQNQTDHLDQEQIAFPNRSRSRDRAWAQSLIGEPWAYERGTDTPKHLLLHSQLDSRVGSTVFPPSSSPSLSPICSQPSKICGSVCLLVVEARSRKESRFSTKKTLTWTGSVSYSYRSGLKHINGELTLRFVSLVSIWFRTYLSVWWDWKLNDRVRSMENRNGAFYRAFDFQLSSPFRWRRQWKLSRTVLSSLPSLLKPYSSLTWTTTIATTAKTFEGMTTVDEADVGISCFISQLPGFRGILKQRSWDQFKLFMLLLIHKHSCSI